MKYFKWIRSENLRENIKLNMCRNWVWHTCFIPCIKTQKTKTTKLRKKRSRWSFLTKLMTCQNLQNKLLNITVLFIWYLLGSLKKMSLAKHGELYFILASVWKNIIFKLNTWGNNISINLRRLRFLPSFFHFLFVYLI